MKQIILFLLLFLCCPSFGQVEVDTFRFQKVKVEILPSIKESGMVIIDTLMNPEAFVLSYDTAPEAIATQKGDSLLLFNLLPESSYGVISHLEQIQVNGKGNKELIVYCDDTYGHSGLGGGIRITNKRLLVYDLETYMRIFDEDYFNSNYQWSHDISDDLEVLSTTEYLDCYNYQIEIRSGQIVFELKNNEEWDQIDFQDFNGGKWIYELQEGSFIGKAF